MSKKLAIAFTLFASASQSDTMPEERAFELFNTLELALRCDAVSGYLKLTLAEERQTLRQIWTLAGMELGTAMLNGELEGTNGNYGRRCMRSFSFPEAPDLDAETISFNVGYSLGQSRACFAELFFSEIQRSVATGPLVGGDSEQEQDDRRRIQQFSLNQFDALECRDLRIPN